MSSESPGPLPGPLPGPHRVRRARWPLAPAAVVVVLVVAVSSVAVLRHREGRYGPLGDGFVSGPVASEGLVLAEDGTPVRLASTPGATATFLGSLVNRGSHAVEITSVELSSVVPQVRWSAYRFEGGASTSGATPAWRSFPATVPGDGAIRLLVTVRHPPVKEEAACSPHRGPDAIPLAYDGRLRVTWRSLLHTHTTTVTVVPVLSDALRVC